MKKCDVSTGNAPDKALEELQNTFPGKEPSFYIDHCVEICLANPNFFKIALDDLDKRFPPLLGKSADLADISLDKYYAHLGKEDLRKVAVELRVKIEGAENVIKTILIESFVGRGSKAFAADQLKRVQKNAVTNGELLNACRELWLKNNNMSGKQISLRVGNKFRMSHRQVRRRITSTRDGNTKIFMRLIKKGTK